MTTNEAAALRDFTIQLMETASAATRRMLEAVDGQDLDYRPHPKAMSAGELAWHIAEAEPLLCEIIARGGWDGLKPAEMPRDLKAIVDHYARGLPAGLARLREVPPEALLDELDLFGHTVTRVRHMSYPLHHSIHHRGQLSTYLRAMGAYVPGALGWSADDRERAEAKERERVANPGAKEGG